MSKLKSYEIDAVTDKVMELLKEEWSAFKVLSFTLWNFAAFLKDSEVLVLSSRNISYTPRSGFAIL